MTVIEPDYAEILRLHRKYRERDGEPLWSVFVRVGQELEQSSKKERCPSCGHTDLVYSRLVDPWCSSPWHTDAHLRASSTVSRPAPQAAPAKPFELTLPMIKLLKQRTWTNGRIVLSNDMTFYHGELAMMLEMAAHGFVRSAEEDRLMPGPPRPPGWAITDKGREAIASPVSRPNRATGSEP